MALRGLKVVEMAGLAPVPFAGMVLAGESLAVVMGVDRVGVASWLVTASWHSASRVILGRVPITHDAPFVVQISARPW